MQSRLQYANIFAAIVLVFYGGFTIFSSLILGFFPSMPYPVAMTSLILYLFGFGLPVLIYCLLTKKFYAQPAKETLSFRPLPLLSVLIVILIGVFIQPVMSLIAQVAQLFFNDITTTSIEGMTNMPLPFLLLSTALLPAIFEELVCRGLLMDGYKETPVWYQILLPGIFFGFLHLNFQQISYAAIMGIYFSILLLITRSIWSTMIIHLVVNGMQTGMAWLMENTDALNFMAETEENLVGTGSILPTLYIALPCLIVIILLTLALCKIHKVKDREKRVLPPHWHAGGWIMYLLLGFLFILSLIVELLMPLLNSYL